MQHSRIGRFDVLDELGRGGMGVVYRARDPADGRLVAIKVLLAARQADEAHRARFSREAEALLRLRHPNLVSLIDVGEAQGAPYLVLELVAGGTLEERLARGGPLAEDDAARLVLGLARALEHAHAEGIVHRDVKPSNVLLDSVTGAPRLTDFGLAKDLDPTRSRVSQTGQFLGTPGFWAPEQAAGDHARTGPLTDVYGLGAVLYATLTGWAPIRATTLVDALNDTRHRAPDPPSQERPGLDPALEAICLRCLAKAPAERLPSAGALADALEGYLRARQAPARAPRRLAGALLAFALTAAAVAATFARSAPAPAPSSPASVESAVDPRLAALRRADGIYEVTTDLVVAAGEELTVEPGARLVFAPGAGLVCAGVLRCVGREGASIVLEGDGWRGLTATGPRAGLVLAWTHVRGAVKPDGEGGGVAVLDGAALDAQDASITGCRARTGGGLFARGTPAAPVTVELVRCRFEDDRADEDGGAVAVGPHASVALRGCKVVDNRAQRHGGGIELAGASGALARLTCEETLLRRNTAEQGAGLNVFCGEALVRGGLFSENSAEGAGGGDGGAVNLIGAEATPTTLDCERARFEGNRAERNGGGLNVNRHATARLRDCELDDHRAGRHGGAAIVIGTAGRARLTCAGTTFRRNRSTRGGAVDVDCGALVVEGGAFVDNTSDGDEGSDGGAIAAAGYDPGAASEVTCAGTRFAGNSAKRRGGGLALSRRTTGTLRGCELVRNRSEVGGALYVGGGVDAPTQASCVASVFSGNSARAGGAVHVQAGTLRLQGGALEQNAVAGEDANGGALVVVGVAGTTGNADLDGVRIVGNTSPHLGGGAFVAEFGGASFRGCTFSRNRASQGGGLYVFSAAERATSVMCFDTFFERNAVLEEGGAVRIVSGGSVTLRGCRLIENEAKGMGGGVACIGQLDRPSELVCLDTTFRGNRALREGGGVNVNNYSRARFEACELVENAALEWGGGLCAIGRANGPTTTVSLERTAFARNLAPTDRGADARFGPHTDVDPAQLSACGLGDPERCSVAARER